MEVLVIGLWVLLVVLAAALFVIRLDNIRHSLRAQRHREARFFVGVVSSIAYTGHDQRRMDFAA